MDKVQREVTMWRPEFEDIGLKPRLNSGSEKTTKNVHYFLEWTDSDGNIYFRTVISREEYLKYAN